VNVSPYTHRFRFGLHDSICWNCYRTISTQINENALAEAEERHVCKPEDMLRIFFDRGEKGMPSQH
jgi:hypothetical protein